MEQPTPLPAYSIRTARLLLRCYEPTDAAELLTETAANREHLAPWLPWAREEQTLEEKVDLVRMFRGNFDLGTEFVYGAFEPGTGTLVGGGGLHPRAGPNGLEIGYWIVERRVRQGLATEMAAALVRVGFEVMKTGYIEIRCDPANTVSHRIPEKLGFQHEGRLRGRIPWPGDTMRDAEVYSLLSSEYEGSPAADFAIEAFDVLNRPLIGGA